VKEVGNYSKFCEKRGFERRVSYEEVGGGVYLECIPFWLWRICHTVRVLET
jgi:hypothetical protein